MKRSKSGIGVVTPKHLNMGGVDGCEPWPRVEVRVKCSHQVSAWVSANIGEILWALIPGRMSCVWVATQAEVHVCL